MKCGEVRAFLSQIRDREEPVAPVSSADLNYLSSGGYVLTTTSEDHDEWAGEVERLSQMTTAVNAETAKHELAKQALDQDERKEHSFLFHLENDEEKNELRQRAQSETAAVSSEESQLTAMEANVNELIQKKSMVDRMVPYGGEYLSLTDLGSVILNDLDVRNYRVADEEFTDFSAEIKATYGELRSIADRAASYVFVLGPSVPDIGDVEYAKDDGGGEGRDMIRAPSSLWSTAIGLAKLQGDTDQIGQRFILALRGLQGLDSTTPNKLMAAEVMTALSAQDVQSLVSPLQELDQAVRRQGVDKETSAGVAATIMAGRRFDGSYPLDRFAQFRQLTSSYEAAALLAVMNVPFDGLSAKFQAFRSMFDSWGYTKSEDTEIGSAFLAIGELDAPEVEVKLKYLVEQLKNYLEYPLVAAAILASIPVFESHEVLDLMEKAVTLLSAYATGLERSELVALAVRMIHGVRNELVREIDSTATITQTPVQFTYAPHPGLFFWYYPVIVAHASYHSTFAAIGGFHPAHTHGVGGFSG